ncbi:MAG: hypothetical protein ACE5I1_09685 [bacterium]
MYPLKFLPGLDNLHNITRTATYAHLLTGHFDYSSSGEIAWRVANATTGFTHASSG